MGKKDSIAAPACIQCFKAATLWSFMVDFIVMVGCIFGVYQLSTSIDIKFGRYITSTINYQLSTINYQLSTINYQHQLSTININFSRKTFVLRPSWAHDFWAHGPLVHPSVQPIWRFGRHKARKRPLWMRFCALPQISAVLQKIYVPRSMDTMDDTIIYIYN